MTVRSLVRTCTFLALAFVLLAPAPIANARSKPNPDKYAHKIEKKLAHFKKGALLHIVYTNNAESTGTLGELGDRSFTLINVETNATERHDYIDVESIGKGSNNIGHGSTGHHHRGPF
jgi:glutamine cyclotransferase